MTKKNKNHQLYTNSTTAAKQALDEVSEIAYSLLNSNSYRPSSAELQEFAEFAEKLHKSYATARYISRCLQQRADGLPEGSPKLHREASFNYHHP